MISHIQHTHWELSRLAQSRIYAPVMKTCVSADLVKQSRLDDDEWVGRLARFMQCDGNLKRRRAIFSSPLPRKSGDYKTNVHGLEGELTRRLGERKKPKKKMWKCHSTELSCSFVHRLVITLRHLFDFHPVRFFLALNLSRCGRVYFTVNWLRFHVKLNQFVKNKCPWAE